MSLTIPTHWWLDGNHIGLGETNDGGQTYSAVSKELVLTIFHEAVATTLQPTTVPNWPDSEVNLPSEFEAVLLDGILYEMYRSVPEGAEMAKYFYMTFSAGLKEMKKIVRSRKSKFRTAYIRPVEY